MITPAEARRIVGPVVDLMEEGGIVAGEILELVVVGIAGEDIRVQEEDGVAVEVVEVGILGDAVEAVEGVVVFE